ncbi:MAG TPA: DUF5916 domain-containing protein [bacterium]|nr:DUF5916 domain-containing protein [bacterium]HPR88109.1 DUF5916 domain-containing protein [bacterium]HPR88888.1 DUF5916 domain-containing protein [bacterium]
MQCVALVVLCSISLAVAAQEPAKKIYTAVQIHPAVPVIDGRGDDLAWHSAAIGRDFIQLEPRNGDPPSEPTEFRTVYDTENLYVLIRAHDTHPEKRISRLVRRDSGGESEQVGIIFDSYHDSRTAFQFGVTIAGVKQDLVFSNDGDNEDSSWDPIWEVKTAADDSGWTAEMRIPFSQLRFGEASEQVWGLEVYRVLSRNNELSLWQAIPKDASGVVHFFGELHGLAGVRKPKRIELLPYSVSDLTTARPEEGNPFAPGCIGHFKGGLDGKIGLASNLTMDFTVNPDFGQVEADPSEVNLSAFETFFQEKRPFFIEGKNIFEYKLAMGDGDLTMDRLFYSRRIGRPPQYEVETADDEYLRAPQNTSILGACKISGKSSGGLSIGLLDAVTQRERAEIRAGTAHRHETTEPLSNYFVGRLQKDYAGGRSSLGTMITAAHRRIEEAHLEFLDRAAYSGGIDFRHSWDNQNWILDVRTAFSHIRGSRDALLEIQTAPAHYFQRPDAPHLGVDSSATSLSGTGGAFSFGKIGGGHWRFLSMTLWRSPGLELNDLGFMRQADQAIQVFWGAWRQLKPWHSIRESQINVNYWNFATCTREHLGYGGNINGYIGFTNNWSLNGGINRESEWLGISALRGGPALLGPAGGNLWFYLSTDERKRFSAGIEYSRYQASGNSSNSRHGALNLDWRVTPALSLAWQPQWNTGHSELQYVESVETPAGPRYIMGRIEQKNLAMVLRLNYSLSPELSIQYYGQPFVASGAYSRYKLITRGRAARYTERFRLLAKEEIGYDSENEQYRINEQGGTAGEYRFDKPDFNFRQFRSNLVVRWEYRPGSTLFFVWSQGRTGSIGEGGFAGGRDLRALFNVYPENVFLVKCNYWFTL